MSSEEKLYPDKNTLRWATFKVGIHSEFQNWLQDNIVIAFNKESFAEEEILETIKDNPKFSTRFSKWNVIEKGGEPIFCVALKEVNTENINKIAFKQFLEENLHNPQYMNKYVAFVDGVFQDSSEIETKLVKKMYEKFGDIEMYVGKISAKIQRGMIESPEPR